MTLNSVTLIGRLAKDVTIKETKDSFIANGVLAIDSLQKDGPASFINLVIFGNQAKNTADYTRKGTQVAVHGALQVRSYENDKKETRYITEVVVNQIQFLSQPKSADEEEGEEEPLPPKKAPAKTDRYGKRK